MVLRGCIISNVGFFDLVFKGEEWLIVRYKDIIDSAKSINILIDYFSTYSKKNDVIVFCYVKLKREKKSSNILVFEKGKMTCVAGSVEEGASDRKIYKKTALCVGKDFLSPLNLNLFFGEPDFLLALTDEIMDREWVKKMYAYKNLSEIPAIIGFESGFFLINEKISLLGRDNFILNKNIDSKVVVKKGYASICVID